MMDSAHKVPPTDQEIEQLHRKYAPNEEMFELVYGHCIIVWDIARQLLESHDIPADKDMVRAGCLLHDIGVYQLWDARDGIDWKNYTKHGILGEALLRDEPLIDDTLAHIASHHTGVGLTKQDIINDSLPLPHNDYLAQTIEERLVMYADKFHSKTTPPSFNSVAWYAQYVAGFGEEKARIFMRMVDEFGEPDLEKLSKKYGFIIR